MAKKEKAAAMAAVETVDETVNCVKQEKRDKTAARAKCLFADYPSAKELYFTHDGTAFFSENDARNHAASLQQKEVKLIKR